MIAPLLWWGLACGGGPGPADAPPKGDPTRSSAEQSSTESERTSWRFRPTLEQSLPEGAVSETIMELSEPRQGTVVVLAAVLRAGAEQVEIERWTFEQIPDQEEGLRVVDPGVPILRMHPGGSRSPELEEIRRRLAAPRVVLTRPVGLDVSGGTQLVERLAAAFAIVRSPSAGGPARVAAAAEIVRGLDDAVVLERDAIGELSTVLVPAPTDVRVQSDSPRRATAVFDADGRTVTLELQRKRDGWAVARADVPPLPTAPTTAVIDPPTPPKPPPAP